MSKCQDGRLIKLMLLTVQMFYLTLRCNFSPTTIITPCIYNKMESFSDYFGLILKLYNLTEVVPFDNSGQLKQQNGFWGKDNLFYLDEIMRCNYLSILPFNTSLTEPLLKWRYGLYQRNLRHCNFCMIYRFTLSSIINGNKTNDLIIDRMNCYVSLILMNGSNAVVDTRLLSILWVLR